MIETALEAKVSDVVKEKYTSAVESEIKVIYNENIVQFIID